MVRNKITIIQEKSTLYPDKKLISSSEMNTKPQYHNMWKHLFPHIDVGDFERLNEQERLSFLETYLACPIEIILISKESLSERKAHYHIEYREIFDRNVSDFED